MSGLEYLRASDPADALALKAKHPEAVFIAGGTCLVDLMTQGAWRPQILIDINHIGLKQIEVRADGSLFLGALAGNAAVAYHKGVRQRCPALAESILAGASAQLRNAASLGGNLLQKTRCYYYREPSFACNKRQPGSGCPAIPGMNRMHAIFGASESCIAVGPSDMAVALAALDAVIYLRSPEGERRVPIDDFLQLPGNTPQRETVLEPNELITGIEVPATSFAARSLYFKVRDRTSYAFALVSIAGAVSFADGRVSEIRLVAGGVAHKPWRLYESERALVGQILEGETVERAAAAVADARTYVHNVGKVEMLGRALRLVLRQLKEMA